MEVAVINNNYIVDLLKKNKFASILNLTIYDNPNDFIKSLQSGIFFNIVFLNVNDLNYGFPIREYLDNILIFMVAKDLVNKKQMNESFCLSAFQLFVTPVDEDMFNSELVRAYDTIHRYYHKQTFKTPGGLITISVRDIEYIEAYKRKLLIYTNDKDTKGPITSVGKISDLDESLTTHGFARTHQGFLVNMQYIKEVDLKNVVTTNYKIPISTRKRKQFMARYIEFLRYNTSSRFFTKTF